ncbi:class F sortase, partial [Mycolicibacterium hassiacum]|uniref:class F sortase n=1 Tax=Mycolicibacterium hassiacum TaxID=46351 RepID=UPI0023F727AC
VGGVLLAGRLAPPADMHSQVSAPHADALPTPAVGGIAAVAPAAPTALQIPSLPLTARVRTLAADECPRLDPPTVEDAYWVGCRALPGTPTDGTVVVVGHSVAGSRGVFNDLTRMVAGEQIWLTTDAGVLGYRVTRLTRYRKDEVRWAPELLTRTPGRLLLVTCYTDERGLSDQNLIVEADLFAAAPKDVPPAAA